VPIQLAQCPAVPWAGHFQCQNINIFFKKIYGSNLSNSTRRLLRFEISKMLIAVLKINIHGVIWYSFRHPFVAYSAVGVAEWSTFVYNTVGMNDARVQLYSLEIGAGQQGRKSGTYNCPQYKIKCRNVKYKRITENTYLRLSACA